MPTSRIVQLIAAIIMIGAFVMSGAVIPTIIHQSEANTLRYNDVAVENAPPIVVLGDVIGAFRGVIVDVLWVRATLMKEKGLFFEANALAEMITRLQPRFAPVWAMQGHNMAYNISVMTHTQAERWAWVRKGIDLLRNEGLRYNPNNIELYKELAYYFMHKVEGIADDAHLYYKKEHCREWHELLGTPPYEHEDRIAWMEVVANAPETIEEAIATTPAIAELLSRMEKELVPFTRQFSLKFDREFLINHAVWVALKTSWYSRTLGIESAVRESAARNNPEDGAKFLVAYDAIASDPALKEAWDTLIAFTRKKVLRDAYNMDARFMAKLMRETGPIDWRHGCAHTLYWSRRGASMAEARSNNDTEIYNIINNDRMATSAMQDLARYGLIQYDPASNDMPSRLPDRRWIDVIEQFFEHLYVKHEKVRGWGSDNFIAFHENFMSSSVRELSRIGDRAGAEALYAKLDARYGRGGMIPNNKYVKPIENFVRDQTWEEYAMQPHVATTDAQSALMYGIRFGLGRGDESSYTEAKKFANEVLTYFKGNAYSDFVSKFGEERIGGIIGNLENVELSVWAAIMYDSTIPLQERLQLYNNGMPLQVKLTLYDDIYEPLTRAIAGSQLRAIPVAQLLPEPPGLAQFRVARDKARLEAERNREQQRGRATIDRR